MLITYQVCMITSPIYSVNGLIGSKLVSVKLYNSRTSCFIIFIKKIITRYDCKMDDNLIEKLNFNPWNNINAVFKIVEKRCFNLTSLPLKHFTERKVTTLRLTRYIFLYIEEITFVITLNGLVFFIVKHIYI